MGTEANCHSYANQIVLKHCRTIDPRGERTLGLITKPDSLTEGTANQRTWLELAQNRDIYFELGWHMVKNRSELEIDKTFLQRNLIERAFFSKGAYADLPTACKGIEALRTRLSSLLHDHLKNELPKLRAELMEKLQDTTKEMDQLGVKRSTIPEQRMFLTEIGQRTQDILKSATRGYYDSPFFGPVDMKADVDSLENIRRFRAVVQHLNLKFSGTMHRRGHKYTIPSRKGNNDSSQEEKVHEDTADLPHPIKMTRNEAIDWVHRTLERSRGCELPGNFNPLIISQLFWEQSVHWKDLAQRHIDKVSTNCKAFVDVVLQEAAPSDIRARLSGFCVDSALEQSLQAAKDELDKIMADKGRHPMTYNQVSSTYYTPPSCNSYANRLSISPRNLKISASPSLRRYSPRSLRTRKVHGRLKLKTLTISPSRPTSTPPYSSPRWRPASRTTWTASPPKMHSIPRSHTTRTS